MTTTRPTSMNFTMTLITNHEINNTIAFRTLFLVELHFSIAEIGHLCVEIHLHDPCMARGRGRKDVNSSSSTQNTLEPAIETSPYDLQPITRTWYWHKQPSHKIGQLMYSIHFFRFKIDQYRSQKTLLVLYGNRISVY